MKKILFILAFICLAAGISAQEHLKFMGLPISGRSSVFVEKLKTKGFKFVDKEDDMYVLSGKFANTSNVEVYVLSTPKTKNVFKVVVFFPKKTIWSSIKSQYKDLQELFGQKYTMVDHCEHFRDPYYEGDTFEEQAVKLGKTLYYSTYCCEEGNLLVEISKFMQVKVVYEDNINRELYTTEKESSVLEDI